MVTPIRRLLRLDVLLVTSGLWFLAKGLRYAFPPLFEPLQAIYGVSNTELGFAFTGFMICYAAMQFPSGILQDRFGPVRVMVAGAVVASIAAILLIVEAGFALLVAVMLIIGTATGLHKTVSIPLLARVYPSHTGRAFGFHETFGSSAGVIAPILAIFFLERAGWRSFYLVAGIVGLSLATLAVRRIPPRLDSPETAIDSSPSPTLRRYFRLFRAPRFTAFVFVTALFAFAYNGVVAFLPLYLVEVTPMGVAMATGLYSLLFVVTLVQLVTGELSDHIGPLWMIAGCIVIGMVGMLGLLMATALPILVGAVIAFGIAGHGYRPVRDAYLTEIIPEQAMGGGIGLIRSLLMGAAAVAPATIGLVADATGFRSAFGVLTASLALSAVALVFLVVISRRPQSGRRPRSAGRHDR